MVCGVVATVDQSAHAPDRRVVRCSPTVVVVASPPSGIGSSICSPTSIIIVGVPAAVVNVGGGEVVVPPPVVIVIAPAVVIIGVPSTRRHVGSSPIVIIVHESTPSVVVDGVDWGRVLLVVERVPGVAAAPVVAVVLSDWFGEGEPVFEKIVALDDHVDLSGRGGTRLLDWCQPLTVVSFSLRT